MTNNNEDFDTLNILKKLDENINQPDKFAEVFCNAASKQLQIRDTLKTIILELAKTNTDFRDELKKICSEILVGSIKNVLKNWWVGIGSILGYILLLIQIINYFKP